MFNYKTFIFQVLYVFLITFLIGDSFQINQENVIEKRLNFYNKVKSSQMGNEKIEIISYKSDLFLSAKTEIPKNSQFLTLSTNYHFTGCMRKFFLHILS